MNRAAWTDLTRRLTWVTGTLVFLLSLLLVSDGFLEKGRAAAEKEVTTALEARTAIEVSAVEELALVTEQQTQRSVAREQRNVRLGWSLLLAIVVFLASVKGHEALRYVRQPALVTIGERKGLAAGTAPSPPVGTAPSFQANLEPVQGLAAGTAPSSRAGLDPIEEPDNVIDLSFVDRVIEAQGRDRETAIPILQALQNRFRYLPEEALRRVCERTEIEPAQIVGVASFYSQFRRNPVGRHLVRVCHGTACHVAGIGPIMDEMRRRLEIPPDADTDPGRRFTLESVNCLGCCSLAPVMMVEEHVAGRLTPTSAWEELEATEVEA